MIRVLVADDSATSRALIASLIAATPGLEVVGEAEDGLQAVRMAASLDPDVVTMDVRMPGLDGFEATRRIMAEHPTPVVIVSNVDLADVEGAMAILRVGALAAVAKPGAPTDEDFERKTRELVTTVASMAEVKVVRRRPMMNAQQVRVATGRPPKLDLVAIAASTGGPAVLHTILGHLAASFAAPILVVQHMAVGFLEGFAEWLGRASGLEVRLAVHGEVPRPRQVLVAPSDRHLELRDGRIHLGAGPSVEGFRPSASVLFDAVARECGSTAAGVVLTGMGTDGVKGLCALHAAGGFVVAQSAATCAVFGMPGAAQDAGVVHHVLDPVDIARWLSEAGSQGR